MEQKVPELKGGESFSLMVAMQKSLLMSYIGIEGLPQYPVELGTKKGQKVIKDFIRRFVEELCEAFTELREATEAMGRNDQSGARKFIAEYNLEIADANHFFLEILLYTGVDVDDLEQILEAYFHEYPHLINFYKVDSPIETLLILGDFYNQSQGIKKLNTRSDCFRVRDREEMVDHPELMGGNCVSMSALEEHSSQLFNVIYSANMFANILNNRDHHQNVDKKINEIVVREKLLIFILEYFRYLDFAGISEKSLFHSYYIKNRINHLRIQEGH